MTLHLEHGVDYGLRRESITKPPPRHRECLRQRTNNDQVGLRSLDAGDRVGARRTVGKVGIAFVRQQPNAAANADFIDLFKFARRNHGAGGVIRGIDHHHARARRNGFLQLLSTQAEACGSLGGRKDRLAIRNLDDVRITNPVRRWNQDFVALLDKSHDSVIKRVLAADADDGFTGLVGTAQLLRMPSANSFTKRRDPGSRGVLGAIALERFDRRLLDVSRRGEIGLAGTKIDDIDASRA